MSGGLNVNYQTDDAYDKEFMRRVFQSKLNDNSVNPSYKILESIILGIDNPKSKTKTSNDNNIIESIDMIAMPYISKGKKVIVNECGEFHSPEYGEFVIELRPKDKDTEVKPFEMPSGVTLCMKNHKNIIFKYQIGHTYGVPVDIMINLFYKSESSEENNSKPAETIKIGTAA